MNRRNLLLLTPLAAAGVAGVAFYTALNRMQKGTFDPHALPSPLVGKPMPDFTLPAQSPAAAGFSSSEVRAQNRPILINFFASWCVPCVLEHEELMKLAAADTQIWGVAYKDKPDAAAGFIAEHGNPYARLAADASGRTAIDFGLYGVPESYLIDRSGTVRWRWAGPITKDVAADTLAPLLRQYA
jgi:cytochrome c biogenesis protein CcmG/thiol:disulfide interchange protein DsbE